jgi:hypothetical protein
MQALVAALRGSEALGRPREGSSWWRRVSEALKAD